MFENDLSNPPAADHKDTIHEVFYDNHFFFVSWSLCGYFFRFIRVGVLSFPDAMSIQPFLADTDFFMVRTSERPEGGLPGTERPTGGGGPGLCINE